jgi:hypothetical protein
MGHRYLHVMGPSVFLQVTPSIEELEIPLNRVVPI